ncbi:ROK family transcriptional regulator [Spirilliplanes yamanashiensis]|uniref:HTH marR-type domain-containing protein n=1 Tax=Spirilliplanes yamanashiensis TaxID=42233 RepID=A0A8J4DFW8_9ACTN|nr:ROK family transcriptional regulator [Spirilliplanes yamanashiensis]MDP9814241.1 putative NBD/HSP70 family sugar kinase [Spirilliplanes yamanashiensis]GIJ00776.1 hypothetical protein Sya03_01280 [Spirilliplanes yamanashiensis]
MSRSAGSAKLLRALNEAAALGHLLETGNLTRADLRALTALSTPTISEVLRRLTEAGLVTVVGHDRGRPGPSAEIYAAHPDGGHVFAVSVRDTGTRAVPTLAGAVGDLTGAVRARAEEPADFVRTDPAVAVAALVDRLHAEAGLRAGRPRHVQLAVPGAYDPRTGVVHHVEVPGWNRPGLVAGIADRLGTTVGVDNDVNLAAVAERTRGIAADADGFALVWLGDEGLGLAIDMGGALLRGARGGAGEIGYLPLYAPGSPQGKVELQDLAGGPAVLALAREHGFEGRTAAAAVAAAVAAPADAAEFWATLGDRVSVGLASVVAVLDPALIVLAGEVAHAGGDRLRDAVAAALARWSPQDHRLAVTAIDDDAALLGAFDAGLAALRGQLIATIRDSAD